MDEWVSLPPLLGVPGIPKSPKAAIAKAEREGWTWRKRKARGGGREYHVASLPPETRAWLLRQAVATASQTGTGNALIAAPAAESERPLVRIEDCRTQADLADWQREIADARIEILAAVDDLSVGDGPHAIGRFLDLLEARALPEPVLRAVRVANARSGGSERISRGTICRWQRLRAAGRVALAPSAPRPTALPTWLPALLVRYQVPQKPTAAHCLRALVKASPDAPWPTLRTLQRVLASLPTEVREWGRMGRAARRAIQPFVRRTTDGLWPMDVVTVDGHLFKAYVRHPLTGRRVRPEVTTYLDIATRAPVGFSAWLAESTYCIWLAMREMVLDPARGVPAIHYSDNGAYRSERHRATLARIGTVPMFSQAYRAQARGVIERLNSSVWVPFAREHDTYCGDDADAEALKRALRRADDDGDNVVAWHDFIAAARAALSEYATRPHKGLGGRSPAQAWADALADGWEPTLLDDDDMHDLLPTDTRTVRRGAVAMPWGRYTSQALRQWSDQQVAVGMVPTDGARVWISDLQGRLICVAERDAGAPYVSESMLEHARAERERGRTRRLERKLESVREEGRGAIEHSAQQVLDLELHRQTVAAILEETPAPVVRAAVAAAPSGLAGITDERRLHAYWIRVRERVDAGGPVSEEDARGCRIYWASAQARSMDEFFDAFGLTAAEFS